MGMFGNLHDSLPQIEEADVFQTASGVVLLHETVVSLDVHTLLPSGSGPLTLLCSWDHTHIPSPKVSPVNNFKVYFYYFYSHIPIRMWVYATGLHILWRWRQWVSCLTRHGSWELNKVLWKHVSWRTKLSLTRCSPSHLSSLSSKSDVTLYFLAIPS